LNYQDDLGEVEEERRRKELSYWRFLFLFEIK